VSLDATRIIAIRHGETAWNVDTRIQGQLDIGLNDTGRWQADRLALALADDGIEAIYASDLWRAYDTALSIANATGLPITTDEGLRERGFGEFEGKTFAEVEAISPEKALLWRKRVPDFAPDGGESLLQFKERILNTVQGIAAKNRGKQIAIVSHGGAMDVLYRAATGQDLQAPRTWELGNAAINRLLWSPDDDPTHSPDSAQGHLTLVGWADNRHLEQGAALDETTA
jgi:2,3-bisphosphoglycerate-dependent phosphoglycerate mutase